MPRCMVRAPCHKLAHTHSFVTQWLVARCAVCERMLATRGHQASPAPPCSTHSHDGRTHLLARTSAMRGARCTAVPGTTDKLAPLGCGPEVPCPFGVGDRWVCMVRAPGHELVHTHCFATLWLMDASGVWPVSWCAVCAKLLADSGHQAPLAKRQDCATTRHATGAPPPPLATTFQAMLAECGHALPTHPRGMCTRRSKQLQRARRPGRLSLSGLGDSVMSYRNEANKTAAADKTCQSPGGVTQATPLREAAGGMSRQRRRHPLNAEGARPPETDNLQTV